MTLTNAIARAGHVLINRLIMPTLEVALYWILWILYQLYNLLLVFFHQYRSEL